VCCIPVEVIDFARVGCEAFRLCPTGVELDGAPVTDVGDIQRLMVVEKIGAPIDVQVLREGRELQLSIVPAELD